MTLRRGTSVTEPFAKAVSAAADSADSRHETVEAPFAPRDGDSAPLVLDTETIAAINEGREQARRSESASDLTAFFRRGGR
jgi:hypothetical protein